MKRRVPFPINFTSLMNTHHTVIPDSLVEEGSHGQNRAGFKHTDPAGTLSIIYKPPVLYVNRKAPPSHDSPTTLPQALGRMSKI
jgi:hypothetical protein